ncbi:acetoin utilization protein acuB [Flavobacterium magnum]|uniref:Acetoin utilization protein acuB n=1 Tax=Flavobacterium magnum TaxID=2162713 RepID=A0A2S0RCD6_9FLAO|nr:CBS domain-containing protein [Flavobacterium magnum]AWA28910.1 acetoin utilization protein acuB [Flavobacterium magnum]
MNTITDFINRDFRPIDSKDTVAEIQDFFAEASFSHFPVVEEGIYIGSVSAEDVETFEPGKTLANYRYAIEVFFARTSTNWFDVLEVFARNHTDVVPVLDDENKYTGYYEIADIVKFFNDTPFLKDPGGIIIVEKGILDYSMGQVVQIVESNNAKILGTFVSATTNDTIQITVKIALGSINDIIQTFRRYDYEIISEHNEDNYLNSLKERSDYLDKYLNI